MSENISERASQKFDLWERKLLDLSARNSLLNVKVTGSNVLPLMIPSARDIEDKLSQNKDYTVISRNSAGEDEDGNPKIPAEEYSIEQLVGNEKIRPVLEEAIDSGKIYTSLPEKALEDRIKGLYRKTKLAIEEDGAGTLFLACGLLKWMNPKDNTPCYAPLVLVPVDLVRKFGVGKYIMRKNDDDTQMNITVLEKLRQDFDMVIPELEGDLPSDENGVDMEGVLNTVRGAISAKDGWEVIDSCVLGIFSFSQFVMWNDLHNHREEIASNKIVKSLLDGQLAFEYEDMESQGAAFTDEASVFLPIAADSSQLYAIKRAGDGASFVLHGPPGTGKSQAITSMIANAIANGKTVLFAAEKKAALDVVYSRLSRIGIAPFCLELYSNKVRKSFVLDQLKEASEVRLKTAPDGDYDKALADIELRRRELDEYNEELTKPRECGYSLYELMSIYADSLSSPDIHLEEGFEEGLTDDRISATTTALGELIASGKGLSGKLGFVKAREFSQDTKFALTGELDAMDKACDDLSKALDAMISCYPKLGSEKDFKSILRIKGWTDSFISWRTKLLADWKEPFLAVDGNAIKARYSAAEGKMALMRNSAVKKVYMEVKDYDKTGTALPSLKTHLDDLCTYQSSFIQVGFETNAPQLSPVMTDFINAIECFKNAYDALNTRLVLADECFAPETADISSVKQIVSELRLYENLIRPKTVFNSCYARCTDYKISPVVDAFEAGILSEDQLIPAFNKAWSRYVICRHIDSIDVLKSFSGNVFDEKVRKLGEVKSEFEKITRQEIYLKIASRLPNLDVNAAASSGMGLLQKAIKSGGRGISIRSLMSSIAPLILKLTPCVLMSPMATAQFIAPSDKPMFDVVIFDEASQLPTCKAAGVLARGENAVIVGDPRQMPPTSFFREQVSTFDEDIEIDDLESILDDCLAIGMPQTHLLWHYRSRHESLITFSNKSFYEAKLYTFPSSDDRACKVSLQMCEGSFDSGKSRTNEAEAQAIADELYVRFNDPSEKKKSYGIVTFNIQQQDLIEDKVDELCSKEPGFEEWVFGSEEPLFVKNLENVQGDERDVILFSVGYGPDSNGKLSMNFGPLNREGGWRRLNVAVTRSRCEMKVFSSITPEQFKITDSTPEGVKAFRNFLMYAGGSEVWDEGITAVTEDSAPIINRSLKFTGIARDIASRLEQNGYKTQLAVGKSGFKIDIGVIDPEDEGKYCLGILIDCSGDKRQTTATSREISQPGVLRGLGWKILRVWSVEWWEDPDAVIGECISAINSDKVSESKTDQEPADEPLEATEEMLTEETAEAGAQKKTEFVMADQPYTDYTEGFCGLVKLTGTEFVDPRNTDKIAAAVNKIVETESPVCFDLIVKRLTDQCGIERVTKQIREKVGYVLKRNKTPYTLQNLTLNKDPDDDVFFYWNDASGAQRICDTFRVNSSFVRSGKEVSVNEAARACCYVCRTQYGLPREDLISEASKAMGFKAASGNVKLLMNEAVDFAIDRGELTENGFKVTYNEG